MSDIIEKFKYAFITCNAELGQYYIKAQFKTLQEAQDAHKALVYKIYDSESPPVMKEEGR